MCCNVSVTKERLLEVSTRAEEIVDYITAIEGVQVVQLILICSAYMAVFLCEDVHLMRRSSRFEDDSGLGCNNKNVYLR